MTTSIISREKGSRQALGVCLLLVLITAALYSPVRHFDFVHFDDYDYVIENPHVRTGLDLGSIRWAFTASHSSNWHPITWLSHMLDCELWGRNGGAHHVTNVLFHTANTVLLFLGLRALTGALWRSALVAALFAWHPLHVESVAWIAERKDVLSTFFWFLATGAYLWFLRGRHWQRYLFLAACLALGLMSKPMLVTFPFTLLLLDYWPLGRWSLASWKGLLLEKIPLFLLIIASSAITFVVQRTGGAVAPLEALPLPVRLVNGGVSYAVYVVKTLLPVRLAVFYPLRESYPAWQIAVALGLIGAIATAAFLCRKRWPFVFTGWFWFVGTLVPVIGIVQVGGQAMADRYTYVPLTGLFVAAVWLVSEWLVQGGIPPVARAGLAGVVLSGCVVGTSLQVRHWKDTISLFEHTVAVTSRNLVAQVILGTELLDSGRIHEAIPHLREALEIRPDDPRGNSALANAMVRTNRLEEAVAHYRVSLAADPFYAETHSNLSFALLRQGKTQEALVQCREAIRIEPEFAKAWSNLGDILLARGEADEASKAYDNALRLDPETAEAYCGLGYLNATRGQYDAAIGHFRRALELKPGLAEPHCGLAAAALEQGRVDDAITHARDSLRAAPLAEAHFFLGRAFAEKGLPEESISAYREALRIRPAYPEAHNNLANQLVTTGRVDEALAEWREALRWNPDYDEARQNLATVSLRIGRVREAVDQYEESLERAPASTVTLRNLAWILAVHEDAKFRDPARAMELAIRASELRENDPETLDVMAAALASSGRYEEAIATAEKARAFAKAGHLTEFVEAIESRLDLYRLHLPFRVNPGVRSGSGSGW